MANLSSILAQAVGVAVSCLSGGQLTTNLVANVFKIIFLFPPPFSPSVVYFSHTRSALIKKPIQRKLTGVPKNQEVHPIPGTISHFWAPW